MSEILEVRSDDVVLAKSFLEKTFEDLKYIKHRFFAIGYRLNEANHGKYYAFLGYDSIYALAEDKFGFKSTTTKNLMEINRRFSRVCPSSFSLSTSTIRPEFEKYNQSQLVEMVSMSDCLIEIIPENSTIVDIRDFKSAVSKYGTHYCLTLGFDESVKTVRSDRERSSKRKVENDEKKSNVKVVEKPIEVSAVPPGQIVIKDLPAVEIKEALSDVDTSKHPAYSLFVDLSSDSANLSPVIEDKPPVIKKHVFKNKAEREKFIRDIYSYPTLVLENKELGLSIRRLDFANGSKVYHIICNEYHDFIKSGAQCVRYCLVNAFHSVFCIEGTSVSSILDYMAKYSRFI